MINTSKLVLSLLSMIFSVFSFQLFAQDNGGSATTTGYPPPVRTNWVSDMADLDPSQIYEDPLSNTHGCIVLREDNTFYVGAYILMASDDISSALPMYIKYEVGGLPPGISPQLTSADLYPINLLGHDLFQTDLVLEVDISNYCVPPTIVNIDFEVSLVTYDNGSYIPYPVNDYPDLFPHEIFLEEGMEELPPPVQGGIKTMCCFESVKWNLLGQNDPQIAQAQVDAVRMEKGSKNRFSNKFPKNQSRLSESLQIQPNPFSESLSISIDQGSSSGLIQIYDSIGRLKQNISLVENQAFQTTLQTSQWTSGVYYIRYHNGTEWITQKLVKQ